MISRLKPNWSSLFQTLPGASRSLFLFSGIWLLVSSSAPAIIDINENGVSDTWEEQYNSGNLFTTFDPAADPDGDGWTNQQEAVTGTDPGDGNPPTGFARPEIEYIPAVYQSPEVEGGEPTLLSPEALRIQWPTLAGKTYTLLSSVELSAQSWLPYGGSRIGSGSTLGADIPLTQLDGSIPQVLFLRVAVGDADTDGDNLSDAEENQLGSNPYSSDGDNDGISDRDELLIYHTNPMSRDTDGDGVSDWDEITVNFTNPLSATDADADGIPDDFEKHLARQLLDFQPDSAAWGIYYAGLAVGNLDASHDYTDEGINAKALFEILKYVPLAATSPSGYLVEVQRRRNELLWGTYAPITPTNTDEGAQGVYWYSEPNSWGVLNELSSSADFTSLYLLSHIDSVDWSVSTFPSLVGWNSLAALSFGDASSRFLTNPLWTTGTTRCNGAIQQSKFRVIASKADHAPLSENYLKITSKLNFWNRGLGLVGDILSVEVVKVQIPKGKFITDWFEFKAPMIDGWNTVITLRPAVINVLKESESAAPADGLVVKKTETLRYRLSPDLPDLPVLASNMIQWYWRRLKWDGNYGEWTAYSSGHGHTFTVEPANAGIFEVKATVGGRDIFFKRASDDPHSAKKKDDNDCLGVVDQDWQINVRDQAKGSLGSVAYAVKAEYPPFDKGDNKCNLFVAHKATQGGATVPWINGHSPLTTYPPTANQWEGVDPKVIPHWTLLPVETYPQPGFIVARIGMVEGHCGILDFDGSWISAGPTNVNRKADLRNDISLRSGLEIYQPAKFRKYTP